MTRSNGTQDVELQRKRPGDSGWLEGESKKPRMAEWEVELFAWALTVLLLVGIFTVGTHILDWIKVLRAAP